ncbi:hypothetical protein ACFFH2_02635 [Enterococcus devriesei]|uniref:hypothetical protein n=1 Tax=Enterococcus devriesei TaxID=319970 RepID=UPI0008FFE4DC|nr:hypothetical protein [Enterococcus devriesei]
MNIDLQLDIGNVWEMLSAIGTVLAVVISLVLAFRESRKKLYVQLTTDINFDKYYQISIYRNPQDYFVISDVGYIHRLKRVSLIEIETGILNSEDFEIHRGLPYSFVHDPIVKVFLSRWDYKSLISKKIKVYVTDSEGRIHKSRKIIVRDLES